MFISQRTAAGDSTGYGLGWGVGRTEQGRRVAAHSGGAIGGRAALYLLPDEGVVVALAVNLEGESLVDEAGRIAAFVADLP
jgi:CubicO group peptidase (beta-lactamase class C family)